MGTKICYLCKQEKDISLFDNQKYHKNTINFKCLNCVSKYGMRDFPIEKEIDGDLFKLCKICKQFKNKDLCFYKTKNTKNGAEGTCKNCKGESGAKRRKERYNTDFVYRENIKEKSRIKNRTNRSYTMWRDARYRAKKYNLPFDIEVDDIIIPELCPILNIKLDLSTKNKNYSPSLDKINPKLGYIKSNIRVISFRANRLKSDLTINEIKKLYEYVKLGTWEEN